ncbi:MAG TPA: SURF1 family protein [Burkholderiaceae bacterium]|nr:SURF1 family protein [Burkholderiaceae bacterium]
MSTRRRFWLLSIAALLGLAVTLSLGRWQLSRAAQKEALQTAIEAQKSKPALDGAGLVSAPLPSSLVHRPAVLQGQWLPEHTVFLDNRQMNGKPGFFVLTPLRLAGSDRVLVVQRGWVPRNFTDRAALPRIETAKGDVRVEGRIAPPPSKLYAFDAVETGPIRQNLDLAGFAAQTHLPLFGVSMLQAGPSGDELQRDWPEANLGVAKHYGYAFQWFGLSGLIAVLYVWFQIVRPYNLQRRRNNHGA